MALVFGSEVLLAFLFRLVFLFRLGIRLLPKACRLLLRLLLLRLLLLLQLLLLLVVLKHMCWWWVLGLCRALKHMCWWWVMGLCRCGEHRLLVPAPQGLVPPKCSLLPLLALLPSPLLCCLELFVGIFRPFAAVAAAPLPTPFPPFSASASMIS